MFSAVPVADVTEAEVIVLPPTVKPRSLIACPMERSFGSRFDNTMVIVPSPTVKSAWASTWPSVHVPSTWKVVVGGGGGGGWICAWTGPAARLRPSRPAHTATHGKGILRNMFCLLSDGYKWT